MATNYTFKAKAILAEGLGTLKEPTSSQSKLLLQLLGNVGLLTNDQAAAYLGVTPGTLEVWRSTKRYEISYIKVGRLVKYRKEALDDFLATQTVGA